jgi:glucosamine--fructose-6-phosphate aminotransferase (isomerizing)
VDSFQLEVGQQPESLRQLVHFYQEDSHGLLASIGLPAQPLLTGMGASFHAALVAALHLQSMGVPAIAVEATDILHYGRSLLQGDWDLVYVSQSGSSAEVKPLLELLGERMIYLSVTNDSKSPLANHSQFTFPLVVDSESFVASKTYLNSLAILWLLVRTWSSTIDGEEFDLLLEIASRVEQILKSSRSISAEWLNVLGDCQSLVFTGFGPHAATAKQSAQTMSEWAKILGMGIGAGALRHGFIEIAGPGTGFVVFAPPGVTQAPAMQLAEELSRYGARVLTVENGRTRIGYKRMLVGPGIDEFLTPVLDIIPAQLFAGALADRLGIAPGFRHLQKVVTKI